MTKKTLKLPLALLIAFAAAIIGVLVCFPVIFRGNLPFDEKQRSFTISFFSFGEAVYVTELEEGSAIEPYTPDVTEGLRFVCWLDGDGNAVSPENCELNDNLNFTALYAPELKEGHPAYLFPDNSGLLLPDELLSFNDLAAAFSAILAESSQAYFPDLFSGNDEPADIEAIVLELGLVFPEKNTSGLFAFDDGTVNISRRYFAAALNNILGRGENAASPDSGALRFADVGEDEIYLLEACVSHTDGEEPWGDIPVLRIYGVPGFVNRGAELYYVQEDGSFLINGSLGNLYFGRGGVYTSGSDELDGYVREILDGIISENPDAERLEWLRSAYNYVRDSFTYQRKNAYSFGETGWDISDAIVMFSTGRGNCYNYAAAFAALARGLGYDADTVSGTISKTYQPHGWVEIEIDGSRYIFDTETEMAYRVKGTYNRDMFMMVPAYSNQWSYRKAV